MQLQIEKLSKRYPNGTQALQDVSLSIPQGMFGLLGPNGAGKSTLMRTLATLQEADSGSARLTTAEDARTASSGDPGRLDGIDVLRQKDEVRKLLGYLPQEFGLYPKVTAERLLSHFAELKGIESASERREVVNALLRQTNLWEHRNKPLGSYSGGMKQRFGIAQALLGNPRLIIVDEPTAGLDPEERVRFHNLLSAIGENVVVILSTHIVSDVSDLCRNMAIIHQGRVQADRRSHDTGRRTQRTRLEESYRALRGAGLSAALPSHLHAAVRGQNHAARFAGRCSRTRFRAGRPRPRGPLLRDHPRLYPGHGQLTPC